MRPLKKKKKKSPTPHSEGNYSVSVEEKVTRWNLPLVLQIQLVTLLFFHEEIGGEIEEGGNSPTTQTPQITKDAPVRGGRYTLASFDPHDYLLPPEIKPSSNEINEQMNERD